MEVQRRLARRRAGRCAPRDGDTWAKPSKAGRSGLGRPPPKALADAAQALDYLRDSFTVVALSNADLTQLVDMFSKGRLAWHGVLSAESVKTYKPDPAVYRHALDTLGREARRTLMVAAHPWDLRAASVQGMRTAFVSRPGEGVPAPHDRFDLYAENLADLAEQLAPGGPQH